MNNNIFKPYYNHKKIDNSKLYAIYACYEYFTDLFDEKHSIPEKGLNSSQMALTNAYSKHVMNLVITYIALENISGKDFDYVKNNFRYSSDEIKRMAESYEYFNAMKDCLEKVEAELLFQKSLNENINRWFR